MKYLSFFFLISFLISACQSAPSTAPTKEQAAISSPIPQPSPTMKNNQTLNIAHRGARSLAPENTLVAAQLGYEISADLWELDVALSADGEIVVIHDDTLERTSDAATIFPERRPWRIEDFTLVDLLRLDFGTWFVKTDPFKTISSGEVTKDQVKSYGGLKIPTLKEALQFTKEKNWQVNVEIKDLTGKPGDLVIVEKVIALIQSMGMEKSVIISSFNHAYVARARKVSTIIRTAALLNNPDPDPVALLNKLNAGAYNPNIKTMDFSQIAPLRAANKDVFVWTVNDEPTMRKLIEAGATGIFTDYPQILKKVLSTR